jgi:predicted AAA+ superfamily ATPase
MPGVKTDRDKSLDQFRGELGESIVAYELMKRKWTVMENLGGQGYDLLAVRDRVQRRIEVKTTDPELKTGRSKNQLTVLLTDKESQEADFLIFYVHGHETYFIIPREAFPSSRSVTVIVGKNGQIGHGSAYEPYRNKWKLLD